jgi:hypothetical protein
MLSNTQSPSWNRSDLVRARNGALRRIGALLFPFLATILMAFAASECLAATNNDDDVAKSSAAKLATTPDAATVPDPGSREAPISEGTTLKENDDTLAFIQIQPPFAVDDVLKRSLKSYYRSGEATISGRCVLLERNLCGAVRSRPIVLLGAVQTGALISDGVTTRQYLHRGYVEVDPLTRVFLGRTPTWGRMAPLGAVQVVAGMWLAERMATSQHVWVRRLWWLPQVVGIAGNIAATAHNTSLR